MPASTPTDVLAALDALPADAMPAILAKVAARLAMTTVPSEPAPARDLTVADLAVRFSRSRSTVRGWLEEGRFDGAYKLRNRDWRTPAAAVENFVAREQLGGNKAVNLSAWRGVRTQRRARRSAGIPKNPATARPHRG